MDYDGNVETGGTPAPDQSASSDEGMKFSLAFVRTPPGLLMVINIVSRNSSQPSFAYTFTLSCC